MTEEMRKALEADGEKLRQMTGEDHGPTFTSQERSADRGPEPEETTVLQLANAILKDCSIPPPEAWDAAVIAVKFLGRPAPPAEAVEAARLLVTWDENHPARRPSFLRQQGLIVARALLDLVEAKP